MSRRFLTVLVPTLTGFSLAGCCGQPETVQVGNDLLRAPFELVELHRWRDGGSLGFVFMDARSRQLEFCLDGKIGSPTQGRWFLGATHATRPGASFVAPGAQTERALLRILEIWVSQKFGAAEREQLTKMPFNRGLLEDRTKFDAWTILHAIARFRQPS